jgi:hypothetical protein
MADDAILLLQTIVRARRQGAHVRALAKCFGYSKSTMGRLVQVIDALSDEQLSQLGQGDGNKPLNSGTSNGDLSQLGRDQ